MRALRCVATIAVGTILAARTAQAQQDVGYVVRQTAGPCLVLRTAPSTDSSRVDCLVPGTTVTGIDAVPFWRRIRLADGREGWSAKKFLEIAGPASADLVPTPLEIPADAWLEVHIVDVGQGDGIWIRTHDDGVAGNGVFEGRNIVIDGGPDPSPGEESMRTYLETRGHHGSIIDALIVSHPHDDHYPGAARIVRHFDVKSYYDPGYPKGGVEYPAFLDAVRAEVADGQPIALHIGRANFGVPDWGRDVRAEFLYAYPGTSEGLGGSRVNTVENNASIVLKLTYGDHSFLFMGDAEGKDRDDVPDEPKYVEKILLAERQPEELRATVLKLAHHGSETSSTLPFMQAVSPEVIVASSGRRKYGQVYLPDSTVLARYCQLNPLVQVYRTDHGDAARGRTARNDADGDHIVIRTNGRDLEVVAYADGQVLGAGGGRCPGTP